MFHLLQNSRQSTDRGIQVDFRELLEDCLVDFVSRLQAGVKHLVNQKIDCCHSFGAAVSINNRNLVNVL